MTLKEYALNNKLKLEDMESVYANKEWMDALDKAADELNDRLEA